MALTVHIQTIPDKDQRYPTAGDYWQDGEVLHLRVTQQECEEYEMLLILHELVEAFLCRIRGVKFDDIDEFDIKFEAMNKTGEPGDDKDAPYFREHQFATLIEKLMALELNVDWWKYDRSV